MSTDTIEIPEVEKLSPISKVKLEIDRMTLEFSGLTIKDANDRLGYEKVSKARKEVKAYRVQVDKDRKSLVDDAVKWQRQVNEFAKNITNQLIIIEEPLQQMEDHYLEEKERLKQEAERLRREKIQNRARVVTSISGTQFNGIEYQLRNVLITQADLESLSDDDFQSRVEAFEAEYQILLAERLEKEKKEKEESDRLELIRKEQEETAAELKRQKDELASERKQLDDDKFAHKATVQQEQTPTNQIDFAQKSIGSALASVQGETVKKKVEPVNPDIEKFKDMTDRMFAIMDEYTFSTHEGIQAFSEFEHAIAQLVANNLLARKN